MLEHFSQIFNKKNKQKDRFRSGSNYNFQRQSKGLYQTDTFDFFTLIQNWREVVGENLTAHTAPIKIVNKSLIILTRHSVYSHQLSYMSEAIKQKIFSVYPSLKSHINSIKFQTSERHFKDHHSSEEKSPEVKRSSNTKHRFSPNYIKTYHAASEEFADIEDNEIKEALISLKIQLKEKGHE